MRNIHFSMLAALALVAGCKTTVDNGYAVDVTVTLASSLSDATVAQVRAFDVDVSGAETFHTSFAVTNQLSGRKAQFVYKPVAQGGVLTFVVTLRDGNGASLGYGSSSPVTLVAGKTVTASIDVTNQPPPDDLSTGGGDDLSTADLAGVVVDLAACTNADMCTPSVPRLIAPLSTALVTSRQPTLKWQLAGSAGSITVDLCSDPLCTTKIVTLTSSNGTSATPAAPLAPGVVFWRVNAQTGTFVSTSNVWEFFVGNRSAPKDSSTYAGVGGDYNRDGHPDVAIGSASGSSYVFLNTGSGVGNTNPITLTGGRSLAYAGDVNGDGYGDLIVGEPFGSNKVYVYHGGPNGPTTPAAQILNGSSSMSNFGFSIAGVGDVDGDGYGDIIIGEGDVGGVGHLYRGGPNGIAATATGNNLAASSTGVAGDVNGDGFADVILCSRIDKAAYTYHGSANGLVAGTTLALPNGESSFGEACAGVGDVNGDGFADVAVNTGGNAKAYVFYGGASGVLATGATALAGSSGGGFDVVGVVQSAGDINADGYGDVVMALYNSSHVVIYPGSAGGVSATALTDIPLPLTGGGADAYAQQAIGAGDLNHDGYGDILLSPQQCSGYNIFAYPGSATGVTTTTAIQSWAPPTNVYYCSQLAWLMPPRARRLPPRL